MTENTRQVNLMTIHENTLRRMCRNNEVPCLHIGRRTFINLDLLVSFLNDPNTYAREENANG